jgi:hypothetical protein
VCVSLNLSAVRFVQQLGDAAVDAATAVERTQCLERHAWKLPGGKDVQRGVTPPIDCSFAQRWVSAGAWPWVAATAVERHRPVGGIPSPG